MIKTISKYIAISILFAACADSSTIAQEEQKPNVLFIMLDDLNDYQGIFGGHPQAKTPNIDKLGASGTVFTNAHTNVPVCSPSRNSLFTGIYPHDSRDFGWTPHFKQAVLKDHKTFIELFKENGYTTLGTGKLLHKNVKKYWTEWGVPEGINYGPHASNGKKIMGHSSVPEPFKSINVVDGSFASFADTPYIIDSVGNKVETGWTYGKKPFRYETDDLRDLVPDEMHAEWFIEKLDELEAQDSKQPFFMGVGFVNPHTPLYAPQKYFDMFPLKDIELPIMKDGDVIDTFYNSVYPDTEMGIAYYRKLMQSYPNGDEGLQKFLQAYLACVAFVDEQVGQVMDALDNSKFKDNTIVILVSDHGWQMGEKDYLYKNSPWEKSTRIPFIIRDPKSNSLGKEISHPVSLIDLFPTLQEKCDLEGVISTNSKAQLGGHSLQPFLENPKTSSWEGPNGALTVLGAGINQPIEGLGISKNKGALWHIEIIKDLDESYVRQQNYTYRTEQYRYILYRNGEEELYDQHTDPNEWNNLAKNPTFDSIKKQLKKEMLAIIE
ncbi:sulfatase [Urechidicola sp. KH5]